jgi:hypothetical protein
VHILYSLDADLQEARISNMKKETSQFYFGYKKSPIRLEIFVSGFKFSPFISSPAGQEGLI